MFHRVQAVDPLAALSANLRAIREAAGFTQQQVADAANLDWAQYRRVERGEVNATVGTLARIGHALGLADLAPMFEGVPATVDMPRRASPAKRDE